MRWGNEDGIFKKALPSFKTFIFLQLKLCFVLFSSQSVQICWWGKTTSYRDKRPNQNDKKVPARETKKIKLLESQNTWKLSW
jgi:hypothetical protein